MACLAAFLLSGCASTGASRGQAETRDAGLYAWVDDELAPYLVDQLSRQPRFKSEPVVLVSMSGADVRPDIDALTRDVRTRLTDRLLAAPGANLHWRPTVQPWDHHRSSGRLACETASSARYYVGIDIRRVSGDNHRVSVRALDLSTAGWVTGFARSWEGRLTHRQQRALAERRPDEYLRGLRVLPFLTGETDLLAAYVARNLSCLMREQGASGYRVLVDEDATSDPALRKMLSLVSGNLARHRTLHVTEDQGEADLILSGSLSQIDGTLNQLWVSLRAKAAETHPASMGTSAYIYLGSTAVDRASSTPSRSQPGADGGHGHGTALLSPLRVRRSTDVDGCLQGEGTVLGPGDGVARGECFSIELDLYRPAHLMVLNHTVSGSLVRLSQDGCGTSSHRQWAPRRDLRITGHGSGGFRWAGVAGVESVYALAVADPRLARELETHLAGLPDGCEAVPGEPENEARRRAWLKQLDRLIERSAGQADWQAVRVRHETP